jgi:hypothetical protein
MVFSVAATQAQPSLDSTIEGDDESGLIVIIHHEYLIKLKYLI